MESRRGTRRESHSSRRRKVDKTRKQRMERSRRERFNSSMSELQSLLSQVGDKENDARTEQADILDRAVDFLKNPTEQATPRQPQLDQNYLNGYNACAVQFIDFLICEEGISADGKAKLLSDLADVLCGASPIPKSPLSSTPETPPPATGLASPGDKSGEAEKQSKIALPRLPKQRKALASIDNRPGTPYPTKREAHTRGQTSAGDSKNTDGNETEKILPPMSVFLQDF